MFKKILFPIDRSREAHNALKVLMELGQQNHSEVLLLTVTDTTVVDASVVGEDAPAPEDLTGLVTELEATISQWGLTVSTLQRSGKPAFTICDVADEMNVDLIVMGSRGLDDDHAKESVTSRVISLSPCPILVIP